MRELLSQIFKNDPEVKEEIALRNASDTGLAHARASAIDRVELARTLRAVDDTSAVESALPIGGGQAEAVVLFETRPSLLIRNDTFEVPTLGLWRERLAASASLIGRAIPSVGRIELARHPMSEIFPMLGTGWVIADNIIATNRHVAVFFGFKAGDRFRFRTHPVDGQDVGIRIDFKEEHGLQDPEEFAIAEIVHIEDDAGLDMAFLKVRTAGDGTLGQPLVLGEPSQGEFIATIGYPGRDSRVPETRINSIFGGIYQVKRLAPGQVMATGANGMFNHDCSTLKGSSGSVVISLDSGRAVGLHFAGQFGVANSAVGGRQLKERLASFNVSVPVAWPMPSRTEAADDGVEEAPVGRQGYDPDFLGSNSRVPLPGRDHIKAVTVPGTSETNLKYTHFSVVLHSDRKLPLSTAVNVDGSSLRFIPRTGDWRKDSRVSDHHHGNELYRRNDYDRGHMVRRLDPVWGDDATARQANADTFFFTNAAPQHKDLNQRNWVRLEEHILDNARARDLKLSVFTGPAFDPGDPVHRGVLIPRRFWKIVAFTDADTGELRASGYLLDQSHLVVDVPDEFAFGAFKTFQVSIGLIAALTQIDFGSLERADVLSQFESLQSLPIASVEDIILHPQDARTSEASGGVPSVGAARLSARELQQRMLDDEVSESALRPYIELDDSASAAFHPVVRVRPSALDPGEEEGAVLMSNLNALSRWRRQRRYRRKISRGWNGTRIVSEGDSWFQYPILLDDVIDQLFDRYAILSFGAAGDLLDDMIRQDEVESAIVSESPHALVISGGGNDLLGGGRLKQYLKSFSANRPAEDYLKRRFQAFVDGILTSYESLFSRLVQRFPNLHVFCHGYDYVIPNGGKWLGKPMESGPGIRDRNLQRQILRVIIDRYNADLESLVSRRTFSRVHYVDCRNTVGAGSWHDELHPTDSGYGRVAERFQIAIDATI